MNEQTPILNALLDSANANLSEFDSILSNIREVMDRLNAYSPKPEPLSGGESKVCAPSVVENTIVKRLDLFNESFAQSNKRLNLLYTRLRELA